MVLRNPFQALKKTPRDGKRKHGLVTETCRQDLQSIAILNYADLHVDEVWH